MDFSGARRSPSNFSGCKVSPKIRQVRARGNSCAQPENLKSVKSLKSLKTCKLEISTKIGSKMCTVFVCTRRSGAASNIWIVQSIVQVGAQVTLPFEISGTGGNVLCKQFQVSSFSRISKVKPWILWKLGNFRFRPKSGRKCALHLFAQDGQEREQGKKCFKP